MILWSHQRYVPDIPSNPATVLTTFRAVHQRLHITECPLGSRHRCLWQTRREPGRTRVPRGPLLGARPHPRGRPRPLQYDHQPLQPHKATFYCTPFTFSVSNGHDHAFHQPKDASTPTRKSTTGYDLLSPLPDSTRSRWLPSPSSRPRKPGTRTPV